MAMRNFVYYDSFAIGETGLHNDFLFGYKLFRGILIYTGTWHGFNIQRYIDGSIGPRPGLYPYPITGLPNGKTSGLSRSAFAGKSGIITIAEEVFLFDAALATSQAAIDAGDLAVPPTSPVAMTYSGNFAYLTSAGDQTYQIDLNAATTTAIPNSPGGGVITLYQDRLVVGDCTGGTGGSAANGNRMILSNPYTPANASPNQYPFTTSPNFVDVGDAWQLTGLFNQKTHLTICKQNAWFVYQGTVNVNDSLRQLTTNQGPINPQNAFLLRNGLVVFVPLFTDMPALFNGAAVTEERHLRFANSVYVTGAGIPAAFGAIELNQPQDFFLLAGHDNTGGADMGCLYHNGAWSYHTFYVATSGNLTKNGGNVIIADDGATGAPPSIYAWPVDLDRPVKVGDMFGAIADGSAAGVNSVANPNHIEFPEWESRDGSQVVVRAVHVSFKKWNTGAKQKNQFTVTAVATRQFNKTSAASGSGATAVSYGQASKPQAWTEDAAITVSDAQLDHAVFRFGDQGSGNGFKIIMDNLVGVAIQKIQLIIDIMPTQD